MITTAEQLSLNDYKQCIKDLLDNSTVKQMKDFKHHQSTTCYSHCIRVSYYSYKVAKKLGLDYIACARAGLLHDLFLYDWRENDPNRKGLHGFTHPKTALSNASLICKLSEKEEDMILKHMWPLTLKFPKYIESYVITFVDKICAIREVSSGLNKSLFNRQVYKKVLRYAYMLLVGIGLNFII